MARLEFSSAGTLQLTILLFLLAVNNTLANMSASAGSGLTEFLFTSESVNEGHPDKLCDQVRLGLVAPIVCTRH